MDNTNDVDVKPNLNKVNLNSDFENLTLDKENNLIEETVTVEKVSAAVSETTETPTFDPISFFNNKINNNPTEEQSVKNQNNAIEFPIQSFFNEPPPLSDLQENVQEKNFNFIRTNLLNKRIERIANAETASPETLSVASVVAEAGSSAQSERSYAEQPTTIDVPLQSLQSSLENNQVSLNIEFISICCQTNS